MTVHQYEVIVSPDLQETSEYLDLMTIARKTLSLSIGTYTTSGKTIFTPVDLGEDVSVDIDFFGRKYEVLINVASKVSFN
jgi:hypothetical protein